jgi:hypothetical protein
LYLGSLPGCSIDFISKSRRKENIMYKRLFVLTPLIALLIGVSSFAEPVGIFENAQDVGAPPGIGSTIYEGFVWKGDALTEQYLITAGGHDIWDASDDFHYAYNTVTGDIRVSANFNWVARSNDWAKYGVMLRESATGPSVHYSMLDRKAQDYAGLQGRTATGGGSSEFGTAWTAGAKALAVQRVTVGGLTFVEGLADFGDGQGWKSRAVRLVFGLPDELLAGVCVTSHDNTQLGQARAWNVAYEANPSLVGNLPFETVPASAALAAPPSQVSGFKIRALKPLVTDGWNAAGMDELLDTGLYKGLPVMPGSEGTRVEPLVNLFDTGGRGYFNESNGYPDQTFPGIDPLEIPALDPAGGDDDGNFACEVQGCIQLTKGLHIIGACHDDDIYIKVGDVLVGSKNTWDGGDKTDFMFQVDADGYYNLRIRFLEIGGGAYLELHEVSLDGTRVLLNDVANGGSAVFAPAQ